MYDLVSAAAAILVWNDNVVIAGCILRPLERDFLFAISHPKRALPLGVSNNPTHAVRRRRGVLHATCWNTVAPNRR